MPGNQGEEPIKVSYMVKRSQGKSAIRATNFKKRVFVLTRNRLSYYDGNLEVSDVVVFRGIEKLRIASFRIDIVWLLTLIHFCTIARYNYIRYFACVLHRYANMRCTLTHTHTRTHTCTCHAVTTEAPPLYRKSRANYIHLKH